MKFDLQTWQLSRPNKTNVCGGGRSLIFCFLSTLSTLPTLFFVVLWWVSTGLWIKWLQSASLNSTEQNNANIIKKSQVFNLVPWTSVKYLNCGVRNEYRTVSSRPTVSTQQLKQKLCLLMKWRRWRRKRSSPWNSWP